MMVRMTVLPSDVGRPVTKSKATWEQGRLGTDRGQSRPERGLVGGAHGTGRDEGLGIGIHGGPPELLTEEGESLVDTGMTG